MATKIEDMIDESNEIQYVGAAKDISEDIEKKVPETKAASLPAVESSHEFTHVVAAEDYSVFTVRQKRMMIAIASFASWIRYLPGYTWKLRKQADQLSPLTGAIYYPAVNQIAGDLHITNSKVSLTVTTYLVSATYVKSTIA
jgi:hypothetical protein